MMSFVVMALCIVVNVIIFFVTGDEDTAEIAGMASVMMIAAVLMWALIYFEII